MNYILKFRIIILLLCLQSAFIGKAQIRYHCGQDSLLVMALIEKAREGNTFGDKIVMAAKALEGTPLAESSDNDSIGTIMVRLDSLNRKDFIYAAIALAKTAEQSMPTLRDFEKNIENISRKKGKDEGFASQFMYGADWIVDNMYRGNLKEMTEYLDGGSFRTKTLDYVSRHPDQFPAMSNPEIADKIRVAEYGYRSHRIPHLKKHSIGNKNVRGLMENGDIIILNAPEDDFDIYDIGIVSLEGGEPTLIHITKDKEVVTIDPYPISRLFKIEGQYFYGYRWLRPLE